MSVAAAATTEVTPLWDESSPVTRPQAAVLADIDGDPALEVVVIGLDSDVQALNGATGQSLWTQTLSGQLRFVAAAALASDQSSDIVITDMAGALHWLDGSTGNLVETFALGSLATAGPVVWDFDGDGRDELLVVTRGGGCLIVAAQSGEEGLTLRHALPVNNSGVPPSVGDVTGDGAPDIAVPDGHSGVSLFDAAGTPIVSWSGRGSLATPLTLVDLTGEGGLEIVFADLDGQMNILGFTPATDADPATLASFLSVSVAPPNTRFGHLAALGAAGDFFGCIFISTPASLRRSGGLFGEIEWTVPYSREPATPTAAAPLDNGDALLAMIDTEGRLEMFSGTDGDAHPVTETGGRSTQTPLLADLDGDEDIDVFLAITQGRETHLQVWSTNVSTERFAPLWVTALGTPANVGHWTTAQTERLRDQRENEPTTPPRPTAPPPATSDSTSSTTPIVPIAGLLVVGLVVFAVVKLRSRG